MYCKQVEWHLRTRMFFSSSRLDNGSVRTPRVVERGDALAGKPCDEQVEVGDLGTDNRR